jgi:hypothetical protein
MPLVKRSVITFDRFAYVDYFKSDAASAGLFYCVDTTFLAGFGFPV